MYVGCKVSRCKVRQQICSYIYLCTLSLFIFSLIYQSVYLSQLPRAFVCRQKPSLCRESRSYHRISVVAKQYCVSLWNIMFYLQCNRINSSCYEHVISAAPCKHCYNEIMLCYYEPSLYLDMTTLTDAIICQLYNVSAHLLVYCHWPF